MASLYDTPGVPGYDINERLQTDPLVPEYSALERLGFGAAAVAPRAIHGVAESLGALGSFIGLNDSTPSEPLPSLPPGITGTQQVADFAGALAPMAVTLPIGGAIVRGGLGAVGITSRLAGAALTDAALFGAMGAPSGGDVAGEQALEGAGYGLLTALPRFQRILPAAALALGSKLFFDSKNDRPVVSGFTQGDISAVAGFATAFLPGQIPTKKAPTAPVPPTGVDAMAPSGATGNEALFNSMFPGAAEAPRSAEESARAMMDLIQARQTAPPPSNPSPYQLMGFPNPEYKSAAESAAFMSEQRAARERAVELEVFRENREIPMGYTPPNLREGYVAPPPEPVPPVGPGAIIPRGQDDAALIRAAFDPANFAAIAKFAGVPIEAIDMAARNMTEIQFAQFVREARNQSRSKMVNMARWAAGLGDERPTSSPLQIDDMWEQTVRQGTAQPTPEQVDRYWNEMIARGTTRASNAPPPPEVLTGQPPLVPEAPLQSAPGEGGTTNVSRSKMRTRPEYRTSEGGFLNQTVSEDALRAIGMPAIRATIGAGVGQAYNQLAENGEDDLAWLRGAIVGALGPRFVRTFQEATRRAGIRPELGGLANKFEGKALPHNLKSEVIERPDGVSVQMRQNIGEGIERFRGFVSAEYVPGTDVIQIRSTDLHKDFHGEALGTHMYDKLIDFATAQGKRIVSDNSVSPDAQGVYAQLQARGFEVRKNPRAMEMIGDDGGKYLVSHTGDPIYEVWPRQGNLKLVPGDKVISPQGKEYTFVSNSSQTRGRRRIIVKNDFEESSVFADQMKNEKGEPILQPLQNTFEPGVKPIEGVYPEGPQAKPAPEAIPTPETEAGKAPATEMKKPGGMKTPTLLKRPDQGGFIMPELSAAMGRGVIGGIVGATAGGMTDDADERGGMVVGGMLGALAFMGGPPLAGAIISALAKMKNRTTPPSVKAPTPATKVRSWANLAENFGRKIEEMSGSVISKGSTRIADRFVRWLDTGLELTMPPVIKEALLGAKGAASVLLDTIDSALLKVSLRFNPDATTQKIANQYLNGDFDSVELMKRLGPQIQGNPQYQNYAKFLIAGRESINSLQKMVREGIGDPKMAKIIDDSIGKYITRSYRMFTNANWRPSEQQVQNLVDELVNKQVFKGATRDDVQNMLRQYVAEVKSVKGMYPNFTFSAQGAKISQAVLKERLDLSDAWKEFLGEIQNPTERIYQTVFRLRPMAEASSYFSKLATIADEDGMPVVFRSYADKDAFKNKILQQLQNPNLSDAAKQGLENQLIKLSHFMNVESHPKFGELSGQIVNRHVFETLSTYDSFTDIASNPFLRSIANAHTSIKLARTAFNPLTVVRNFVTSPMFMMIGKTSLTDISNAWDIVKDAEHPLRAEIMRQGIGNVDQVKTEFFKEFENITGSKYNFGNIDLTNLGMGKIDLDLAEKYGRRGLRGILDIYRLPDNLVRIGTYLSAKRRIAQELGLALDNPDVLAKATEFTNRYTMNYDAVAPAIKKVRQLPFANLFISYTAEMARIAKNLVEDVVMGDGGNVARHNRMYAAAPLAMLAILPELMQSSSESSLSEKDQRDWEQAKRLMPDYSRSRFRFVTGRDKKTGQFHYVDFTPLVASDAFNQMVRSVVKGDTAGALSVNPLLSWDNTPALNIAVEQITGKDQRTQRDFRGGADRVAAIAKEVLPPWVPSAGSEYQRGVAAHTRTEGGELGITNYRTGVQTSPSEFWATYFGPLAGQAVPPGVRIGSTNLDILKQRAISEAKNMVANETAYLNDVMKSDANVELKQRAIERFKVAVATIRENLSSRIGESQ